jgi:hemerythrin
MEIEWDDKYLTGNKKIDEQHKQFIIFINDVQKKAAALSDGESVSRLELQIAVNKFVNFALYHFAEEEILLIKCGCLKCKEHILTHDNYKKILQECNDKINHNWQTEDLKWFHEMCSFVQKYYIEHIQKGHDDGFLDCIRAAA